MTRSRRGSIRKGRVYHITVAQVAYRAFVWEDGSWFCGRVEEEPQIMPCRGRTAIAVRDQLCAALAASIIPAGASSQKP